MGGRIIESREYTDSNNYIDVKFNDPFTAGTGNFLYFNLNAGKQLKSQTLNYYGADGNLISSQTRGLQKDAYQDYLNANFSESIADIGVTATKAIMQAMLTGGPGALGTGPFVAEDNFINLNTVNYAGFTLTGETLGFDVTGKIIGYQLIKHDSGLNDSEVTSSYTHTYAYFYKNFDSYLEYKVEGSSTDANYKPGTTLSYYDVQGNRISVTDSYDIDGYDKYQVRYFAYNLDNQIIRKDTGEFENGTYTATHETEDAQGSQSNYTGAFLFQEHGTTNYYYSGTKQLGQIDGYGRIDFSDMGFRTMGSNVNTADTQYTVNSGDTLRSISQLFYGNGDLWYLIADANGLTTSDERLVQGLSLKVPGQVNSFNNADTFKTYNPSEILGNTTPGVPYVAPPQDAGCNVIAAIIIAVVTVVVTAYLGPDAGAGFLEAAVGYAGAAAVGSVAGQVVGIALGVQDKINWKSVAIAGLSAGITQGLGVGKIGSPILRSVANNVVSQGVKIAVGVQDKFEWQQVAVAGVAAGITQGINHIFKGAIGTDENPIDILKETAAEEFDINDVLLNTGRKIIRAGINHFVEKNLFGTGKFNFAQVAADAFGNALGEGIVGQLKFEENERNKAIEELGRKAYEQGSAKLQTINDNQLSAIANNAQKQNDENFTVDNEVRNAEAEKRNNDTLDEMEAKRREKETQKLAEINAINQANKTDLDGRITKRDANKIARETSADAYEQGITRGQLLVLNSDSHKNLLEDFKEQNELTSKVDLSKIIHEKIDGVTIPIIDTGDTDVNKVVRDFYETGIGNTRSSSDARAAVFELLNYGNEIPFNAIINLNNNDLTEKTLIGKVIDRQGTYALLFRDDVVQSTKNYNSGLFSSEYNEAQKRGKLKVGIGSELIKFSQATINAELIKDRNEDRVTAYNIYQTKNGEKLVQIEGFFTNALTTNIFESVILDPRPAVQRLGIPVQIDSKVYIIPKKWYQY